MKDIVITPAQVKRELQWASGMLALAFLINVGAIIGYNGDWSELYTQWHVVLALAGVLTVLSWGVRGVVRMAGKHLLRS